LYDGFRNVPELALDIERIISSLCSITIWIILQLQWKNPFLEDDMGLSESSQQSTNRLLGNVKSWYRRYYR